MSHRRRFVATLSAIALATTTGVTVASCPPRPLSIRQQPVSIPGHAEPHTPGSGSPLAMPASAAVQRILGATPDLDRVSYLRTAMPKPSAAPPRVILILVPGFIGGATDFSPLAKQLVLQFGGNVEVWAIDRRANQLEDRRGALHARAKYEASSPAGFVDALQFYFPDADPAIGTTPFPNGLGDVDVDGDGVFDPPFALPDALGGSSPWQQITQDDARFMAHWGFDTWARDWKRLVDRARNVVGPSGLVLFGGHSAGTGFAGIFAAYDFDPGAGVDAAYQNIDGLLLLEGGGPGTGSANLSLSTGTVPRPTTTAEYDAIVSQLASPGGPDVFLANFSGASLSALGAAAELGGLDGIFRPDQPALLQRTPLLTALPLSLVLGAPMTTQAVIALFIDDDHSPVAQLAGSFGFSDDGPNGLFLFPGFAPFYLAMAAPGGALRGFKTNDDPTLPTCPPNRADASDGVGCAILDRGARPRPTDPPAKWGRTAEVSSLDELLRNQYTGSNFLEWYYQSGRLSLDASYGRDSNALGDERRLAVTQNARMDRPVLCIGGSNGLAPSEASFQSYLSSIATPSADREIFIAEGYAHLDPLTAEHNVALPVITDWINRLLQRKLVAAGP